VADSGDARGTEPEAEIGLLEPIGHVRSSLQSRDDCPRQPDEGAPPATLVLRPDLEAAVDGLAAGDRIIVLTWLHEADRQKLTTRPRGDDTRAVTGVFATRSPDRPNPIGIHDTTVTRVRGTQIEVSQLEALDGTPILDIKPVLGAIPER
jgi:tRNA-Thr(GGU) m(6)t(6)A37 methyltransferase TsaA